DYYCQSYDDNLTAGLF
nr:immunoglobulin light chain junction region [Macaca mulatta]MOY05737.1 immunoglobulin light chain junction region [Macaca mulatta]MOY06146.1 immunoglobulin light chain junction region [Macaca mulatta]MOY06235.1 immunoglobulin light chain junction region [Macaca mulatta]MOY06428.1 immunoglobulin light chain junction region [Macaca mulatta]